MHGQNINRKRFYFSFGIGPGITNYKPDGSITKPENSTLYYGSMWLGDLSTWIIDNQRNGFMQDPALQFKSTYQNLQFDDIQQFYENNIQSKPLVITIVGNKKQINYDALSKYGKVNNLNIKNLYHN